MNINTTIERTLETLGVGLLETLPCMTVEHSNHSARKKMSKLIRDNVGKHSGVYIYTNQEMDRVYYVGKAKELHSRILCHYDESTFNESLWDDGRKGIAGDKRYGMYPAYFRDYIPGPIVVRWTYIKEEQLRIAVEALLTQQLRPEFKEFQKKFLSD